MLPVGWLNPEYPSPPFWSEASSPPWSRSKNTEEGGERLSPLNKDTKQRCGQRQNWWVRIPSAECFAFVIKGTNLNVCGFLKKQNSFALKGKDFKSQMSFHSVHPNSHTEGAGMTRLTAKGFTSFDEKFFHIQTSSQYRYYTIQETCFAIASCYSSPNSNRVYVSTSCSLLYPIHGEHTRYRECGFHQWKVMVTWSAQLIKWNIVWRP